MMENKFSLLSISGDVCAVCGVESTKKCSVCRSVSYCNKEHQKVHWKTHKKRCWPFKIVNTENKGRCVTTTKTLCANDIIAKEEPLLVGPRFVSPVSICLSCHSCINDVSTSTKCPECLWPICSPRCATEKKFHALECDVLSVTKGLLLSNNYRYETILPLRCLLLQKRHVRRWETIIGMEAHMEHPTCNTDIYREIQDIYVYLKKNVFDNLKIDIGDTSQELVHRICGIIDVNSLEVLINDIDLTALYYSFSLLEHSCLPNVNITFDNYSICIKAATKIESNSNLSTSHTNITWGTQARQQHLLATKYISCECKRCRDPTELGTNFSSLLCLQDNCHGYIAPVDPLLSSSSWKCSRCNITMPANDANDIISQINFEVDELLEEKYPDANKVKRLLTKLLSMLHPHHYNCFAIKHSLIQLYGRQSGYLYSDLQDGVLKKKIEYCNELLWILSKLDPFCSRVPLYVAVIKYELSGAILEMMKRKLMETFNLDILQEDEKEAKMLLRETISLLNEDRNSRVAAELTNACRKLFKDVDATAKGHLQ